MKKNLRNGLILAIVAVLIVGVFIVKKVSEANVAEQPGTASESSGQSGEKGALPFEVRGFDLADLKSHGLPLMLDFGSEQCGPCQQMKPDLKQMYEEMQGKVVIQYTDIWAYTGAADGYPVQVIPTQAFYDAEGKPFVPSDELREKYGLILYYHRDTNEHMFTIHQGPLYAEDMHEIFAEMGVKADD